MYFVKTPKIISYYYKDLIWKIPEKENKIYLTFDDGPGKRTTSSILDILDQYNAKATFFCIGNKAKENSKIIDQIREKGHAIGNHSHSHLNGNKTSAEEFFADIEKCNEVLQSNLFRPPYGKITRQQIKKLKNQYKIILWSLLPGDFDKNTSKEKCLRRSIKNTTKGTIIVFHDNLKTIDKIIYTLPKYLEHFSKSGFIFEPLGDHLFQ